jgi:hypothetical protein
MSTESQLQNAIDNEKKGQEKIDPMVDTPNMLCGFRNSLPKSISEFTVDESTTRGHGLKSTKMVSCLTPTRVISKKFTKRNQTPSRGLVECRNKGK